jgi:hypothetical protein
MVATGCDSFGHNGTGLEVAPVAMGGEHPSRIEWIGVRYAEYGEIRVRVEIVPGRVQV